MSNNIFSAQNTTDAVDAELARLIEDAEAALCDGDMDQEDFDSAVEAYENASVERYMEITESGIDADAEDFAEEQDFSEDEEMLAA